MHYGAEFAVGNVRVHPFPVPHDAREPVHYRFEADGLTLGILTDTGHISTHVAQTLACVDALARRLAALGQRLLRIGGDPVALLDDLIARHEISRVLRSRGAAVASG